MLLPCTFTVNIDFFFMCFFHYSAIEELVRASTVIIFNTGNDVPVSSAVTNTLVDAVSSNSPFLAVFSIDVSSIQIQGKDVTNTTTCFVNQILAYQMLPNL